MVGVKRKASFAPAYERPAKLSRKSTSSRLDRTLSTLRKEQSVARPSLQPVKLPPLRTRKSVTATRPYKPQFAFPRFPTLVPPSRQTGVQTSVSSPTATLRRAPTLPVQRGDSSSSDVDSHAEARTGTKKKFVPLKALGSKNSTVILTNRQSRVTANAVEAGTSAATGNTTVRARQNKQNSTSSSDKPSTKSKSSAGARVKNTNTAAKTRVQKKSKHVGPKNTNCKDKNVSRKTKALTARSRAAKKVSKKAVARVKGQLKGPKRQLRKPEKSS